MSIRSRKVIIPLAVSILAGGLSTRMGRDKARLRIGGRTMLARIRAVANVLGVPVRVIRKDRVARCGPLGGIYTALITSRAEAELFLPCDMPFITPELLRVLSARLKRGRLGVFAEADGMAGFPFIIGVEALERVNCQIAAGKFSLQSLAGTLDAVRWRVPKSRRDELRNFNTPDDVVGLR